MHILSSWFLENQNRRNYKINWLKLQFMSQVLSEFKRVYNSNDIVYVDTAKLRTFTQLIDLPIEGKCTKHLFELIRATDDIQLIKMYLARLHRTLTVDFPLTACASSLSVSVKIMKRVYCWRASGVLWSKLYKHVFPQAKEQGALTKNSGSVHFIAFVIQVEWLHWTMFQWPHRAFGMVSSGMEPFVSY